MIDLGKLEQVVLDQKASFGRAARGLDRDVNFNSYLKNDHITIISGLRRSGKSTLLRQFADRLADFHYLNFDDERLLRFDYQDLDQLLIVFKKYSDSKNILFDEVQNVAYWERFIRRLHDDGYKLFITGSNAKLLSSELATHLTGRYLKLELYPFSFKEYLHFYNVDPYDRNTNNIAQILKYFDSFNDNGSIPLSLVGNSDDILKQIYEDIIYRDIIIRFNVKKSKSFREVALYVHSNFGCEFSYGDIAKMLGFKSSTSVKDYLGFLEESYLTFTISKYDYSLKKQFLSNKKAYLIDNGIQKSISFRFMENSGRLLENTVFLELKRRNKEIYYHKAKKQSDFITRVGNKIVEAIQVTQVMDAHNKDREIGGLIDAMQTYKLKEGLILTVNQQDEFTKDGYRIKLLPIYEWLLNKE